MNISKFYLFTFLLIIVSFAIGVYFYPQMPELMPTHWNMAGEIDAYSSKTTALFIMPIISLIMFLLFVWFPKADPKKDNVKFNQAYYERTVFSIMLFLFCVYIATIMIALGYKIDIGKVVVCGIGLLFILISRQIKDIKPNWFFGIRTPWTISNDIVWEKTHKIGAQLFKAFGLILFLFGLATPIMAIPILIAFCLALIIWSFLYPYLEWRKLQK